MLKADKALEYGLISSIVESTNNLTEIAALSVGKSDKPTSSAEQYFDDFNGEISPSLFETDSFKTL